MSFPPDYIVHRYASVCMFCCTAILCSPFYYFIIMLIFFTPTECSLHSSRKLTERPTQILSGARSLALVLVCLSFPMAEVFYINKSNHSHYYYSLWRLKEGVIIWQDTGIMIMFLSNSVTVFYQVVGRLIQKYWLLSSSYCS